MNQQLIHKQIQFAIRNNVKVELNDREVQIEPLFKLIFTIFGTMSLTVLILLSTIFEITFTETVTTKSLLISGLILSGAITTLIVTVYYWFTFIKPNVKFDPEPSKVVVPEAQIEEPPIKEIRDITKGHNNPFIKSDAEGEDILVANKPVKLYEFGDLIFNFKHTPHAGIFGSSGSGKSVAVKNIINLINKQLDYPPIILMDAGQKDFKDALAFSKEEIIDTFKKIHLIAKGRQKENKKYNEYQPLIIILEEAETFFRTISAEMKKAEYDKFSAKIAEMMLVCRKLNMNFVVLAQSAKLGDGFPSSIRDNTGNRFYMRMPSNVAKSYILPFDMTNIPSGTAYFDKIDNFIQFAFFDEDEIPPMNLLSWRQLESMANVYKRKYNLEDFESDEK